MFILYEVTAPKLEKKCVFIGWFKLAFLTFILIKI